MFLQIFLACLLSTTSAWEEEAKNLGLKCRQVFEYKTTCKEVNPYRCKPFWAQEVKDKADECWAPIQYSKLCRVYYCEKGSLNAYPHELTSYVISHKETNLVYFYISLQKMFKNFIIVFLLQIVKTSTPQPLPSTLLSTLTTRPQVSNIIINNYYN